MCRLWLRAQGKAIAYFAYAAVMAAAVCGLWAIGQRDYELRLERAQHELVDVTNSIAMLVSTCIDHADTLRRQAEALLEEPTAPESAHRLYAELRPSGDFAGYALDRLPQGENPDEFANLTGAGEIPPSESGAGREIQMALALNPLFEAVHSQIPDVAWVYYTSKNHFIALHPWAPSRQFHWSEELLTYDFYKLGLQHQNPRRAVFWTDIYLDAGGKGLMATLGKPVYDQSGRFRGTVDLDLTLGTMSRMLLRGDFAEARVLLVNDRNRVIADSTTIGVPLAALTNLSTLLPKSPDLASAALTPDARADGFTRHGDWLLHQAPIDGAPWRLLMLVDRTALLIDVLKSIWVGFVGIALLGVALVAVEQRRRAAGALTETIATLQHMTLTLAAARDEAQQANKAKSMLLANVSHELRTPLNAIIGFSDMMRYKVYGPLGDARYEGYADDIQRSGKLLLDLINDLLDATKLESGHYELVETECDLAAILREAAGLVKVQAERAGIAVEVSVGGAVPPVLADARALRQIVLNLLSNAVKFTPAKGLVRLGCAFNGDGRPTITVEDTGRGIAPDEIKNLFRPFARTAEAKKASTPGTGLGLAIVKSLVELHQGTIAMESRLGSGTTVTVKLPATRVIAPRVQGAA